MKNKRNYFAFSIFLILTVICMILIFKFSSQSGEDSSGVSISFYDIFLKITGFDFINHDVFRKFAHFSEYAALGFCSFATLFFYFNKTKKLISFIFCFLYAVSDEIHQFFVPERAGRFSDVLIDCSGSVLGILIFTLILILFNKIRSSDRYLH